MRGDLVLNYLSLAVMVASGLLIDAYIAVRFGPSLFGVFNQVSAIYLVATQFAVGGVHFSASKYLAEHIEDAKECSLIFSSALWTTFVLGLICSAILFGTRFSLGAVFEPGDGEIVFGIGAVAFALLFFSLNKTMLSSLNGQKRMREFAIAQATRYILIAVAIFVLPFLTPRPSGFMFCYLAAEALLFVGLTAWLGFIAPISREKALLPSLAWVKRHLSFGARGFATGVLVEANTRIDILILGLFLDDAKIGIYSLASRIGEGFLNVIVVVKRNINPALVGLSRPCRAGELKSFSRKIRAFVYPSAALLAVAIYLAYPFIINYLGFDSAFLAARLPLAILLIGIVVSSGLMVFDNLPMQAGRPGLQTLLFTITFVANAGLNFILIPLFGISGSALATSLSYIGSVALLVIFSRRYFKLDLI